MNIDNRKILGVLPNFLYDYDPTKVYNLLQQVTYLGSTFQSKCDNNNNIPCVIIDGVMQVHESWTVIARGSDVGISHERLDNVEKVINDLNVEVNNLDTDVKSFGTYVTNLTEVVLDKTYDPANYSGLGRVVLKKKEAINGKNILTQDMINQPNSIYEIQYDFDLNGSSILIPLNSVLYFNGGTINNGSLNFNNTILKGNITLLNVEVTGNLLNSDIYLNWFRYSNNTHDDWYIIKSLFNISSNIHLENRVYNLDKKNHMNDSIVINDNTNILGNNATFNLNCTTEGIDVFIKIQEKRNISISDINIKCNIGSLIDPPAGHGSTKYLSSGIYAILINNSVDNLILNNINMLNVAYGLKTSKTYDYTKDVLYHNININNCYIYADMPIQGSGFAYLNVKGSKFKSRGVNSGNHAIYILSSRDGLLDIDRSLYFYDCEFNSPYPDGQVIQIYDAYDYESDISNCYFTNCKISGRAGVTASISQELFFNNCELYSDGIGGCNPTGKLNFYNCNITNYSFYENIYINNCNIKSTDNIIIGDSTYNNKKPLVIHNSNITTNAYFIYNNIDYNLLDIKNCNITVEGSALVSQRVDQIVNLEFINCIINVRARLVYAPSKSTKNTIIFSNCVLTTKDKSVFFTTNAPDNNIELIFNVCNYMGDILNNPLEPRYYGSTPPTTYVSKGQMYYNNVINKPIYWNGASYVDNLGYPPAISKGSTSQRPILTSTDLGFQYYDTTLKKYICWNGAAWTNLDGTQLT